MSFTRASGLIRGKCLVQRARNLHAHIQSHCLRTASGMAQSSQPDEAVGVIGAGVLGLSTATLLQKRHPTTPVVIVAAETPSLPSTWTSHKRPSADYASVWAGAHYRPIPMSTRQLEQEAELAQTTAKYMYDIADHEPEAGVSRMPAKEYLDDPPEQYLLLKSGDVYAGPGDHFRILDVAELPAGVAFGCEYEAYVCNVHVYCCWLLDKFLERGGKLIQTRLNSIEDIFNQSGLDSVSMVVNCSGRNFDQDPKVQSIRGQTVLVRNQYHSTITRQKSDGTWTFLIPRPGGVGTVVGGTKEIGDMETGARPQTREELLQAAVRAFPDFVDHVSKFEVVMDNVGRRPWRDGGLRIENEQLPGSKTIIHAYGAGGRGYELSWGVAERVADLYDATL